jgi:hypothetical protein
LTELVAYLRQQVESLPPEQRLSQLEACLASLKVLFVEDDGKRSDHARLSIMDLQGRGLFSVRRQLETWLAQNQRSGDPAELQAAFTNSPSSAAGVVTALVTERAWQRLADTSATTRRSQRPPLHQGS